MRQGNDAGTQYRSAIYTTSAEQAAIAQSVAARFQDSLTQAGYGAITTEIAPGGEFYYAEPYHQQYLGANPGGYCGLGVTGVSCPAGHSGTSAATRERGGGGPPYEG
jgi:peptide-methionine (S)-S-oxide reductase